MKRDSLPGVLAELNYVVASEAAAWSYMYPPPPGTPRENWQVDARLCRIEDARPFASELRIDEDGFLLLSHPTSVDLSDQDRVRTAYYPEVQALLRKRLGARRVVVFDHAIRRRDPGRPKLNLGRDNPTGLQPVGRIHCDYTETSGPRRMREVMGGEYEALSKRRYCQINLWRSLKDEIEDAPLALCAAWSVKPEDRIACELRYPARTGEFYLARYNPAHRWFYFPRMKADEVLVFKGYDSDASRARFTFHSAFEDPLAGAAARPRQSIEVRAFAFY